MGFMLMRLRYLCNVFHNNNRLIILATWLCFVFYFIHYMSNDSERQFTNKEVVSQKFGNQNKVKTSFDFGYKNEHIGEIIVKNTPGIKYNSENETKILKYFNNIKKPRTLIKDANELLVTILKDILGKRTKVILLDLASIENKGDPAISIGELTLLSRLNISVIYYCWYTCGKQQFIEASEVASAYSDDDVAVLSSGGGNLGIYVYNDVQRMIMLSVFTKYKFVLLSQSAWFGGDPPASTKELDFLEKVRNSYYNHGKVVLMLRDLYSFKFCQKYLPNVELYLAPDMVFGFGKMLHRFAPPIYDVLLLARRDIESPMNTNGGQGAYKINLPSNVTYIIEDWFGGFPSPQGNDLIDWSYMMFYTGLLFLQRGSLIISDRMHGFILATLLDLPILVIDNKIHKISHLIDTWCPQLDNFIVANLNQELSPQISARLNWIDQQRP